MSGIHAQQICAKKKPPVSLDYEALVSSDLIVAPVFINENHSTDVLIANITSTVSYINLTGTSDDGSRSILAK